jgi:branched-chain amino acid aminotransferase
VGERAECFFQGRFMPLAEAADAYVRPLAFKSTETIGVRLHDVADELCLLASPMGDYVETGGIRCGVSSRRRIDDTMIPPGAGRRL